jgi:hypothetical protein
MNEQRRSLKNNELYKLLHGILSHDDTLAYCVLEGNRDPLMSVEDFEDTYDVTTLIRWMGNLMTIAGAYLFSAFNQWRIDSDEHPSRGDIIPNALYLKRMLAGAEDAKGVLQRKSSAAFRVLRVLDGLYDIFDMNFFVIKSIIVNSQLEAGFNSNHGKRYGLSKMLGFPDEESFLVRCDLDDSDAPFVKQGQNLSKAFSFINLLRNDPLIEQNYDNVEKYKPVDVKLAFEDVFRTMEFMKRVRLDIDNQGNVGFCETNSGKERYIPSYGVVRVFAKNKENKSMDIYRAAKNDFSNLKAANAEFYLLEKIEYLPDNKDGLSAAVSFVYKSFDESDSVSVYFAEKNAPTPEGCEVKIDGEGSAAECFKRVSGYLPGTRSATSFFRGMITTHYRYHNTLAPSIVDAIDKNNAAKVRVLRKFVKTDPAPFKESFDPVFKTLEDVLKFKGWDKQGKQVDISALDSWGDKVEVLCEYITNKDNQHRRIIDWDTLIARILVYEGPTEILRTVLLPDNVYRDDDGTKEYYRDEDSTKVEETCKEIIAGLEMRYIDDIFEADDVVELQRKYVKLLKSKIQKYKELFPGEYATKMECKAVAQTYIDAIVRTLTNLIDEDGDNDGAMDSKFAENSIKDMLQVLNVSANNNRERCSPKAERAFKQTIMAFISFYAGIKESCQTRVSYEFEKSAKILSPSEIEERQKKMETEFFVGMSKKTAELSKKFKDERSIELMLKALWEFANNDKDEKYYHAMLARTPIDDVRLKKIFKVDEEKGMIVFFGSNNEQIPFTRVFQSGDLVDYLRKIIAFLYGEDVLNEEKRRKSEPDKSNYTLYKEHVKRVVYPQIVTFAKHREDGDANDCLLMDHNGAFAEWHDGEVQILTEFKYKINHAYYAIPNLNRIETEWWVDPILVSCYRFDKELREALQEE